MRNSRWPAQAGNCVVTNCAPSVIRLNASALSDSSSLTLSVSSPSLPVPSKTFRALVDSGSTHCFVDAAFARANKLVLSSIPPVQLRLFDGVTTKYITQSVLLPVVFSTGECIDISCYVTPLDSASSLVLGFDWCHAPQPFPPSRDPFPFQMPHDRPFPYVPTPTEASLALGVPSLAR